MTFCCTKGQLLVVIKSRNLILYKLFNRKLSEIAFALFVNKAFNRKVDTEFCYL